MEERLRPDIIEAWFPRCIDPAGGFYERFDETWQRQTDPTKLVVFQSRMTWIAAKLAVGDRREEFAAYTAQGVRFLTDKFVRPDGGIAWDYSFNPVQNPPTDEVHAYGISFAIFAAAAAYRATGDESAFTLAKGAFGWLETHLHDARHGGYFECTDLSGAVRLVGDNPDSIGTPYGQKSQNTHLHLLEAFTELIGVWPDPLLVRRLREVQDILLRRLYHPDGWLYGFAWPDWEPVDGSISHGHDIEAAHLLMDAALALDGEVDARTAEVAASLIAYVLRHGFDEAEGGVYSTGNTAGEVTDRAKIWWVQAEALLGLIRGLAIGIDDEGAIVKTWRWITQHQVDHENGGWHAILAADPGRTWKNMKGEPWKAAYHDGRALLFGAQAIRDSLL